MDRLKRQDYATGRLPEADADSNSASIASVYYYAARESERVAVRRGCQSSVFTFNEDPDCGERALI